jgi:hypothetical protein
MMLMQLTKPESVSVKPGEAIQSSYHILINDVPKMRAHGSTISTQFTNAWNYMISGGDK